MLRNNTDTKVKIIFIQIQEMEKWENGNIRAWTSLSPPLGSFPVMAIKPIIDNRQIIHF